MYMHIFVLQAELNMFIADLGGFDIMPNGGGLHSPGSPIHTSDSEECYYTKLRYRFLARRVLGRWRRFVVIAREQRLRLRRA